MADGNMSTSLLRLKIIDRCRLLPSRAASTRHVVTSIPWPGLQSWRNSDVDKRRSWGRNGPIVQEDPESLAESQHPPTSLVDCGLSVLNTPDPISKAVQTHRGYRAFKEGRIGIYGEGATAPDFPVRDSRPITVSPKEMPHMETSPLPKAVYMLHNLAHIELNAIDLAWDTVVRFSNLGLDPTFYSDFAHVADDESRHFSWCVQRIRELGHDYGDMPVHDILWKSATASRDDVTARLALIPLCQEARGLDAGPRLAHRLSSLGDKCSSALVERIALEEQAHVAVGLDHFTTVLGYLNEDPAAVFRGWIDHLCPSLASGRFDHKARRKVGFNRSWYDRGLWEAGQVEIKYLLDLRSRLKTLLEREVYVSKSS